MKFDKMVQADAERAAAADMFYGEGAGTRRKLLSAEISDKAHSIEGYADAFDKAYAGLDMNKFAQAAIKERKAIDRAAKAGQNFRALKSGNLNNLSTGIFVVVGGAYLLHQTGYDKVLEAKAKVWYKKAKTEIKFRHARAQGRNVEKLFA